MTDAAAAVGEKRAAAPDADVRDTKVARTDDKDEEESTAPAARLAKRKVAIFFGYCGSGYSGLQMYVALLTQQPRRADD